MRGMVGLFALLIFVLLLGGWASRGAPTGLPSQETPVAQKRTQEKDTIMVGNAVFKVEIANSEEERRIGLSKHSSLQESRGMLFVFEENSTPSIWMKNMNFSIDIIWIDNGRVVQVTKDVPPALPGTPDPLIPRYTPREPIDYVLEVRAGEVGRNGIEAGNEVALPKL